MRVIAILVGVIVGCFPVIGASKGYEEYGDGLTETAEIRIGHLLSNPGAVSYTHLTLPTIYSV